MLAHIIEIRQVTSDVPLMGASVICANYFEKLFSFFFTPACCDKCYNNYIEYTY